MATFQRRNKSWRATIRRMGQYVSATFDTKAEAEVWAVQTEANILKGLSADAALAAPPVPEAGVPAVEALQRYSDEVSPTKRGGRWEQVRLKAMIRQDRLFKRSITSISGADLAEWRDQRLRKVSSSTVNRELCLLSSIFSFAMRECRMGLMFNPCSLVTKPRKPRARTQRISKEEREAIIAQLGWDGQSMPAISGQWVAFSLYLALETAMRKGEILSLRWQDIDFQARHVHLDITKNGDERYVPLSKAATALLRLVETGRKKGPVVPVKTGNFDKLFRDARREVGLSHIHFHDSRREAATTMATKLSNVLELAAVTGHKSLSMLQIYYKPKAADLAARLDQ